MEVRIQRTPKRLLVGKSLKMTLKDDRTQLLWKSFVPFLPLLKNRTGRELVSMQVYPLGFNEDNFDENTPTIKWAAAEVDSQEDIPQGLETHVIEEGLYAVFNHRGPAAAFPRTAAYIYGQWLPRSGYMLDDREHFELLPPGYRPKDPNATEEIWIPVKNAP